MGSRERLDGLLALSLGLSRRQARALVREGLVTAGGKIARDPAYKPEPAELIGCPGRSFTAAEILRRRVFMLNKPAGCVCADRDGRHPAVASLFAGEPRSAELHCVGRLDLDTRGLLLVTDDGDLSHSVTAPRRGIAKRYLAAVRRPLRQSDVALFGAGLRHPGERKPYAPAVLEILSPTEARVTVTEGRFHEVKRLFECVGNELVALKRLSVGALRLDEGLPSGCYRRLSEEEIAAIFA